MGNITAYKIICMHYLIDFDLDDIKNNFDLYYYHLILRAVIYYYFSLLTIVGLTTLRSFLTPKMIPYKIKLDAKMTPA